jgi:hypothetical protein
MLGEYPELAVTHCYTELSFLWQKVATIQDKNQKDGSPIK